MILAYPVAESLESELMFPAKAKYVPSLDTIDSTFLKSDSIETVFEAGAHGNAEAKFIVKVFELVIKIGAIDAPPESVIRKYIFAYAFNGNAVLNAVGILIVVVLEPDAGIVPVIGLVLASNRLTVNVCVLPNVELVESL